MMAGRFIERSEWNVLHGNVYSKRRDGTAELQATELQIGQWDIHGLYVYGLVGL